MKATREATAAIYAQIRKEQTATEEERSMRSYMTPSANGTAHRCKDCGMDTPVFERGEHHTMDCPHRPGTFKHTPPRAA